MKSITLCSLIMAFVLMFAPGSAYTQVGQTAGDSGVKVESQPNQASEPAPAKSLPEVRTPAAEGAKTDSVNKVPKLNMAWECKDCTINEKVIPLIQQNYYEEAIKNGKAVSETDIAEVAIVDFRQRPPGVRVMFGIFAGKDRLGLRVRHNGSEFNIDDYSANAITGMNLICSNLAKELYDKLAR